MEKKTKATTARKEVPTMTKIIATYPFAGKTYYMKNHISSAIKVSNQDYIFMKDKDVTKPDSLTESKYSVQSTAGYIECLYKEEKYEYILINHMPERVKCLIQKGLDIDLIRPLPNKAFSDLVFRSRAEASGCEENWILNILKLMNTPLEDIYTEEELKHIHVIDINPSLYLTDILDPEFPETN